ncbi:MAG: 3-oxoacyl-[acyl-carrier-protein] reductase [Blautia wexlerae]
MLKNKIALITGAGRGIGRAIAIALAKEGAEVVINYNGSEERAKEVKQTIEENGGKASIYKCNVSDFAACEAMIKDIVKAYGHLDILVNNAGITKDGLIMKMKEEDFDSVLNVNLKGTFNTIRHSARQMLKQRSGKIINISSVSGILGNVGQANYAASKAGVIGLTKTMARELGSRGITVNAIAPGFVDTEMTEVLSEEIRENACKQIILGRFGKPEDIANTAVFLASDKADYITGQVISVDGGMNV